MFIFCSCFLVEKGGEAGVSAGDRLHKAGVTFESERPHLSP